jgi:hypothetical protein
MTIKARVRAGRLVVDEPTDLPEGTEVGGVKGRAAGLIEPVPWVERQQLEEA